MADLAAELPDTRLVYVGDREADIVERIAMTDAPNIGGIAS